MIDLQEMFSQVPNKLNPPEPELLEYTLQRTLNRLKEHDYKYVEVVIPRDISTNLARVLRTHLEPKGYRVSVSLTEKPFYKVTIQ